MFGHSQSLLRDYAPESAQSNIRSKSILFKLIDVYYLKPDRVPPTEQSASISLHHNALC